MIYEKKNGLFEIQFQNQSDTRRSDHKSVGLVLGDKSFGNRVAYISDIGIGYLYRSQWSMTEFTVKTRAVLSDFECFPFRFDIRISKISESNETDRYANDFRKRSYILLKHAEGFHFD